MGLAVPRVLVTVPVVLMLMQFRGGQPRIRQVERRRAGRGVPLIFDGAPLFFIGEPRAPQRLLRYSSRYESAGARPFVFTLF